MLKRSITAIVAVLIFFPVFIFSDTWVLPIVAAVLSAMACFEMISCVGQKKNLVISIPIYVEAIFFPIFLRYCGLVGNMNLFIKVAVFCVLATILYIFAVAVFQHERICVTEAGLLAAATIYIIAAFTCIVYVRDFIEPGFYVFLLCICSAFVTDIFAYFTGYLFGKHKLIPAVSPKKTVEGAIGGVVFCVLAFILFGFVIEKCTDYTANYLILAIGGVFISVVSQIGDLVMSLIKRKYGIKDYGKIFPGHGGVLDRCDSVIAVIIVMSIIGTFFNLFN